MSVSVSGGPTSVLQDTNWTHAHTRRSEGERGDRKGRRSMPNPAGTRDSYHWQRDETLQVAVSVNGETATKALRRENVEGKTSTRMTGSTVSG